MMTALCILGFIILVIMLFVGLAILVEFISFNIGLELWFREKSDEIDYKTELRGRKRNERT